MEKFAKLSYAGKSLEFPLVEGTEDELGIDIKNLRTKTKLITLDPGFKNTGSCQSAITFLDGENGILRYRGYSIEDLANNASFLEVSYLLIFGELPNNNQLNKFLSDIQENAIIDEDLKKILDTFPKAAHPMGILSSLTSALIAFNPTKKISLIKDEVEIQNYEYGLIVKLLAKIPILVSWVHRKRNGLSLDYGNYNLGYVENITKMMFQRPHQDYFQNDIVVSAMNKLLILHADHEQNCSTSTVRIVGSSEASLFASVSAGISALWGRLHGGANQAVLDMLEAINSDGGDTKKFMLKAKDKNDSFRLMGFGHRVYKNFDPRAKIIKVTAHEVLNDLGIEDPILDIAKSLEKEALSDPYFTTRRLYPNVDFYSGIIYKALNIPKEMFTVMFALGRVPGWIAHWKEMRLNKEPIGRPRQIYIGENQRAFLPLNKR
ncbi:MAG: citrate (Si)-synthase [Flavobacteriaceae bacterium]|jgi:citrate synthase|nr:citrate (Si)-synthase [Flavobacteriaceae bacterium]|tara:strand:+ start:4031 stop:5332 length:1302 start_codon:yes stop_codon:yes gene_type:complete